MRRNKKFFAKKLQDFDRKRDNLHPFAATCYIFVSGRFKSNFWQYNIVANILMSYFDWRTEISE